MKYIVIICLVISSFACKKDYGELKSVCGDGTIEWRGDPAVDGLGWIFKQAGTTYILKNLPAAYQQSGLNVSACVKETRDRVSCFCTGEYFYYSVESIH